MSGGMYLYWDWLVKTNKDAMEHQVDPTAITEEMLGERPELDPFLDDTPIDCDLENPEVCESCQ